MLSCVAQTQIEIINADQISFNKKNNKDRQVLTGNVKTKHKNQFMSCDSAYYYADENKSDIFWQDAISVDWNRKGVEKVLFELKDYLELQSTEQQGSSKVSYLLKEPSEAILPLVRNRLRQSGLAASPHLKCHWYLDIVPLRASRSEAIRFLTLRWNLSLEKVLIVASQQGDAELIKGLTTALVPLDHDSSLDGFKSQQRVFFSNSKNSIADGLKHFRF